MREDHDSVPHSGDKVEKSKDSFRDKVGGIGDGERNRGFRCYRGYKGDR